MPKYRALGPSLIEVEATPGNWVPLGVSPQEADKMGYMPEVSVQEAAEFGFPGFATGAPFAGTSSGIGPGAVTTQSPAAPPTPTPAKKEAPPPPTMSVPSEEPDLTNRPPPQGVGGAPGTARGATWGEVQTRDQANQREKEAEAKAQSAAASEGRVLQTTFDPPKPAKEEPQPSGESVLLRGGGGGGYKMMVAKKELEGVVYDPEALLAREQALRAAGKTTAEAKENLADELNIQAGELQRQSDTWKDEAARRRADMLNRMAALERDAARIADMKVDTRAVWADRGAFTGLLASFATALGAYGSAKAGYDFKPGEIIQRTIDREIDAQKANIELAKDGLKTRTTLLGEFMKNADPELAENMAKSLLLQSLAAEAQANNMLAESKTIPLAIEAKIAENAVERSKILQKTEVKNTPVGGGGGGGGGGPRTIPPGRVKDALVESGLVNKDGSLNAPEATVRKAADEFAKTVGTKSAEQAIKGTTETEKIPAEKAIKYRQAQASEQALTNLEKFVEQHGGSLFGRSQILNPASEAHTWLKTASYNGGFVMSGAQAPDTEVVKAEKNMARSISSLSDKDKMLRMIRFHKDQMRDIQQSIASGKLEIPDVASKARQDFSDFQASFK